MKNQPNMGNNAFEISNQIRDLDNHKESGKRSSRKSERMTVR